MPSAARLMGAVCLAVLAFVLSGMVMTLLPESTDFGWFVPLNIALGLVIGWTVMGSRVGGDTTAAAINNGVAGVFVLMLWGIALQAINEMMRLAMRNRYSDPFEAVVDIFQIGAEYGLLVATVPIGLTLAIGAVISGLLTEYAHRRWP